MALGVVGGTRIVPGSHEKVRWGPSLDHMVETSVAADLNNRWRSYIVQTQAKSYSCMLRLTLAKIKKFFFKLPIKIT